MKKVKAAFRGIVIFLLCMIEIYPLFWMLTASFKKQAEWSEKPAYALNDGFYFQNYSDAWTRGHMSTFFKNSLITTLVALVFIVFFSVTVGFAVTKMEIQKCSCTVFPFRYYDSGCNRIDPAVSDLQQNKSAEYQNLSDHYLHSFRFVTFHLSGSGISSFLPG